MLMAKRRKPPALARKADGAKSDYSADPSMRRFALMEEANKALTGLSGAGKKKGAQKFMRSFELEMRSLDGEIRSLESSISGEFGRFAAPEARQKLESKKADREIMGRFLGRLREILGEK